MDWTVYWFMLPVCVAIASAAMFSGISGAAMLMPVSLLGFPAVGAPTLTAVEAVGMSLLLETSGFGTGVYRYLSRGLVDTSIALRLLAVAVPAAVAGAVLAGLVPATVIRLGYGVGMVLLAVILARETPAPSALASPEADGDGRRPGRELRTRDGSRYRYVAGGLRVQRVLTGAGGAIAGVISTGVGELTLPGLVRRSHVPIPVAAATSTVVVAGTVAGAALTHLVQLAGEGGLAQIPWNLLVWAAPGAVAGAFIGTHLQGRVPERASRRFFAVLFGVIGLVFVAVFGFGLARPPAA